MLKELLYRFKIGQLGRGFSVIFEKQLYVYEAGNGNGWKGLLTKIQSVYYADTSIDEILTFYW